MNIREKRALARNAVIEQPDFFYAVLERIMKIFSNKKLLRK